MQIALNGVGKIKERDHRKNFSSHPSIKTIRINNGLKQDSDRVSFYPTNKTKVEDLLPNIYVRKACGRDMLPPRLIKESSGPVIKILITALYFKVEDGSSYPCIQTGR